MFYKDPSQEILYKCKTSGGNWPAFTELISSESSEWCSQPRLAVDSLGSVHIAWNDETDYAGSGIDSDIFYKKKGAFYNAFGPGIIIAIGQGSVNSGTGLYNFSYGQLRFIGIGFLGGGPSFYHSTPTFSWTTGQYTTSSFFGLSMPIGSLVIIIGFLSSNGAISGNSYL